MFAQTTNPLFKRHVVAPVLRVLSREENMYPFTPELCELLVWGATHLPKAVDAIVRAENQATDDPSKRTKSNAYIRECFEAIRRRMETVDTAEAISYGFLMQRQAVEKYGPIVLNPTMPEPRMVEVKPVVKTRKLNADQGVLF